MSPRPRKPGSPRPYTTGEMAAEMGVSKGTVIKILERGDLPWHWSDQERQTGWRLVEVRDWRAYMRRHTGNR